MPNILLEAQNIVKHFPIKGGIFLKEIATVKAVDGVSLKIDEGETVGLVGESGCGKDAGLARKDADHLPGSLLIFESPQNRIAYRWRTVAGAWHA